MLVDIDVGIVVVSEGDAGDGSVVVGGDGL